MSWEKIEALIERRMSLMVRRRAVVEDCGAILGPLAYTGFISYSQKDAIAAARLHRWLEHFKISRDVADQLGRPTSLGRFFRDDFLT